MLFASKGYRGTTVSELAAAAGVNRALISYHFGSKAGLYSELLEEAVGSAAEMLAQAAAESSADAPEMVLVRTFARVYEANPHLAPMLVREHLDPEFFLTASHAEKLRGFIKLTQAMLDRVDMRPAAREFDPQIVHLICVGSIIYFVITAPYRERMKDKLDPPPSRPSLKQFSDVLAEFLRRALRD